MAFITETERSRLLERFTKYVKIWTTSDSNAADNALQPSTERQFDFARVLEKELGELGLLNVQVTEHCYVYGLLPGSDGSTQNPDFCLLAHMDTVEECSGQNVNPVLTEFSIGQISPDKSKHSDGAEISVNSESDSTSSKFSCGATVFAPFFTQDFPEDTIISTDGTTLLGADDKAGVAEIMEAITYLVKHPEVKHAPIEICFSPDEETGHGMDNVPLNLIKSKKAYTVDGGNLGELETECFNAYKSEVTFTGVSTHTGTARGVMVNAAVMASSFVSTLPRHEAPETTDGFEGFYAVMEMSGSIETASVTIFLRDFTDGGMKKRLATVKTLAEATASSFGGSVKIVNTEQYKNMKEELEKAPETVNNLVAAYKAAGVEPVSVPIRGGTDGSRLTEMGIPTPNLFTGGHNFHSRTEWASLNEMCKAAEILIHLAARK